MNAKEWLMVLGGGAALAAIPLAAGVTVTTGILAGVQFLVGAAGAAKMLHTTPSSQQGKKDARGQFEDDEEPK